MVRTYSAEQFVLLDQLGRGSFGVVYKALDKITNQLVAIKQIDLETSEEDIDEIQKEITILSTCKFPQIIKYYGCYVNNYKLSIIMEILNGGSCLDLLVSVKAFEEQQIAVICRELLKALYYLHSNNKIHRDIKAANILVDDSSGDVKMVDFGVATQLSNNLSKRNTFVGTPFWMSPEVILQHDYNYKTDIWSLGITAIELALGKPPLSNIHPLKVLFLIPKNSPPGLPLRNPVNGEVFSKNFHSFIKLCLQKTAGSRPTAKQLLSHPFIKTAGRNSLLLDVIHLKRKLDADKVDADNVTSIEASVQKNSITTQITFDFDELEEDSTLKKARNPFVTSTASSASSLASDQSSSRRSSLSLCKNGSRNISPASLTSLEASPDKTKGAAESPAHKGPRRNSIQPNTPSPTKSSKHHRSGSKSSHTGSRSNPHVKSRCRTPKSKHEETFSPISMPHSSEQAAKLVNSNDSKVSLFDFEIIKQDSARAAESPTKKPHRNQLVNHLFDSPSSTPSSMFHTPLSQSSPSPTRSRTKSSVSSIQSQFNGACLSSLASSKKELESLDQNGPALIGKLDSLNTLLTNGFNEEEFPILLKYLKGMLLLVEQQYSTGCKPSLFKELVPEKLHPNDIKLPRQKDNVEELLLSRWAEGVLERWNDT